MGAFGTNAGKLWGRENPGRCGTSPLYLTGVQCQGLNFIIEVGSIGTYIPNTTYLPLQEAKQATCILLFFSEGPSEYVLLSHNMHKRLYQCMITASGECIPQVPKQRSNFSLRSTIMSPGLKKIGIFTFRVRATIQGGYLWFLTIPVQVSAPRG